MKYVMSNKVAIIGGGASGMMAAIHSASKGNIVTIFEKNQTLGKKILLTGNGRCNITNSDVSWKNYFGSSPKFASSVLSQFSNSDTIRFFEDLGLVLTEENHGRLFPRSNQAQSVIDVLEEELSNKGVNVLYNQKIRNIEYKEKQFSLTTYQKKKHVFEKVIIATGGKTFPKTGSSGDGFRFAKNLGHNIIEPIPVSTPLRVKSVVCNKLQGIKVNVGFSIYTKERLISKKEGELLFTHLGLSAPVVLESSRFVSEIIIRNNTSDLYCTVNFFPEYSQDSLNKLVRKRIQEHPDRTLGHIFTGMLPKKVLPTLLRSSNKDPDEKIKQVSNKKIHQLLELITKYKLPIVDVLGWDVAQFTAGGVDTKEIDSQTMESKIVPGLFFSGEVVDIDGESGGYNLQWAWSSGYVAGSNS